MVVPGNFPIGCMAYYLTLFRSSRAEDYDPGTGCINWLNDFAMYHNRLLLKELSRQRRRHPNVTIIYGDYYQAAMTLFRYPRHYGAPYLSLSQTMIYTHSAFFGYIFL